jgi:hypothetical protein
MWVTGDFFTIVLTLVLIIGSGVLHLTILIRDIRSPAGEIARRHPSHRVFAGVHALLAALFFLQALLFLDAGILWFMHSGQGIAWVIVGGALLAYGAVSSVGMAYSSYRGIGLKVVSLVHTGCFACGFLAYTGFLLTPSLPPSTLVPALTFLFGLIITILQVWLPRGAPLERASAYSDTMLFEDDTPSVTPLFPPELEERYSGARFLHQGGIARVFSARRRDDGVMVAVKVPIRTDEKTGRSLFREMNVWRTLVHPGIVQVYASNILPVPFVEMEYLPGSLEQIPVPVDPGYAAVLIRKVAQALSYAHLQGVIHRDLKPGNILLTPEGEPKIGDWGLSRNDRVPAETTLHGFSLSYAAPEQLDPGRFGRTTEKTDVYQLGIILYRLLNGVLPFPGESIAEVTRERLQGKIELPSSRAPDARMFDGILQKCLAVDPAERYQTLQDLISDLEACEEKLRDHHGGSSGEERGPDGTSGE